MLRGPVTLLDQLGGLKAVQARHLDIQQDHREVVSLQQPAQRLLTRLGGDELLAEWLEDRRQREQVLGTVVHQEKSRHYAVTSVLQSSATIPASSSTGATRAPGTAARAARGISGRCAVSGSSTSAAPPSSTIRASPAAPSALAPVSRTPDAALATRFSGALEEDVDRGPRVLDFLLDG